MNWKNYEKEVHKYFSDMYPTATITYDAKLIGRYSKKERQIDVLIEDDIAGFPFKLVVDAKLFSKKIDVKAVESFIAMLDDVEANQGLLITQIGYSTAAINRAFYGPQKLELDVLNFDELLNYQGEIAIPYQGKQALFISAPFGWVVDANKQDGFITCLYQRGLNLDEAIKRRQWIYCNFWHKDKNASNIEELVSLQNANNKSTYPNLKLSTERAPNRHDGLETYIRVAPHDERKMEEITGFIDCGEFIAFFALHSTKELRNINLIKLSHILKYSTPFELNFDNTKVIKQMEAELDGIYDVYELAASHNQLAKWYSEMNEIPKEMEYRRLCWNTKSEFYENIKPLIQGEINLENISEAINYSVSFFDMAPKNPTVMQDLLSIYESSKNEKWFEEVVSVLKSKYKLDKEASANICLHYAMYLERIDKKTKSIEHFELALSLFKQIDENHYVIQQINNVLASNIHDR